MRITHSRDRSETNYFLDKPLEDVDNFKDLGVTITRDLSWGNHISLTVNKANEVLGSIKRSVGTANINVFSMLYKSLVRPILEYAVPVWCPYHVKDIHALENVQRRASRLALRGEKLNYNSCTSLLLRKYQNLLCFAPGVQWALKVYRVCSIHVFCKCFEPCPYLVCHVTTIENV